MVRTFPLDVIIKQGKDYATGRRWGLHIKKIGTDSTTPGHLKINEVDMGDIFNIISPLHSVETNLMGVLDLKDLTYVIPPNTDFIWEGASGSKCRMVGEYVFLAPGEMFPAELLTRYGEQVKTRYTYIEVDKTLGVDEAIAADTERVIGVVEPTAIERYIFDGVVMASVTNYPPTDGDLALRFKYDDTFLETMFEITKTGGIDFMACPRPPTSTTEFKPFSFEKSPITLEPEHKLYAIVRNVKGASIAPAAGTALSFKCTMICRYQRIK